MNAVKNDRGGKDTGIMLAKAAASEKRIALRAASGRLKVDFGYGVRRLVAALVLVNERCKSGDKSPHSIIKPPAIAESPQKKSCSRDIPPAPVLL